LHEVLNFKSCQSHILTGKGGKMKNSRCITAILTTAIVVSLLASCLAANGEVIVNRNPDAGTISTYATYEMSESNSAYSHASKYGDLMNEAYAWHDPHGNTPERTGFNLGPAPDRPDVLFRTNNPPIPKVILGRQVVPSGVPGGVDSPFVQSFSGAPMAMAGQLLVSGTIRVNIKNSTTRSAVISLDPHTGTVNWASIVGFGPTAGGNIGSSLAGSSYIFYVDDTHFCTVGLMAGGLMMWRTDGTFLWQDNAIQAGAYYHGVVVVPAPVYKVFITVQGTPTHQLRCYTLNNPEQDRNVYDSTGKFLRSGRSVWNYTIDEAGNTPIQCYGDGRVYMASYSSTKVYAINATNGEKIWETDMPGFNGYMTCYGDGKLFVGCLSFYIHALNATNGKIIWRNSDGEANRAYNVWCMNYAYGRLYVHDLGVG
jgi:outer membrane protein assembly factor BamB